MKCDSCGAEWAGRGLCPSCIAASGNRKEPRCKKCGRRFDPKHLNSLELRNGSGLCGYCKMDSTKEELHFDRQCPNG